MKMILTGKAEEDFFNKYGYLEWEIDDLYLNALIIEWFKSKGIYFNMGLSFLKSKKFKTEIYIDTTDNVLGECYEFIGKFLDNEQEVSMLEAFKVANEIYNSRTSHL